MGMRGSRLFQPWRVEQLRIARNVRRLRRARRSAPPPATSVTKAEFVQALRGTAGIKSAIAKRLKVHRDTVRNLLAREDWGDVLAAYKDEVEDGIDDARSCIREAINQRGDIALASATARWLLSRARPKEFGNQRKVIVEGGKQPMVVANVNVEIESLNLAPDVKRQILQAMDELESGHSSQIPQDAA